MGVRPGYRTLSGLCKTLANVPSNAFLAYNNNDNKGEESISPNQIVDVVSDMYGGNGLENHATLLHSECVFDDPFALCIGKLEVIEWYVCVKKKIECYIDCLYVYVYMWLNIV